MEMVLRMESVVNMDDEHFYTLCRNNPDIRLERTAEGDCSYHAAYWRRD